MEWKNLIPSLAIAIFGGGGLITGLLIHGLFFEACREAGTLGLFEFAFEATVPMSLTLGSPFVVILSALLFLNVFASLKFETHEKLIEYLSPSMTFIIVFAIWIAKDYVFVHGFGWTGFLHASLIGGISAFSHGTLLSLRNLRESVDFMLSRALACRRMGKEDKEILAKRLELEQNSIQTTLQWIVTGTIIFLTAAVAGYYYSPLGNPTEQARILSTRLLNLFIGTFWGLIGVIFGIVMPMLRAMDYLKASIVKLVLDRSEKITDSKTKQRAKKRGD